MSYIIGYLISLILTIIVLDKFIKKIKNKIQQPLLEEGPKHEQKAGTPTMGGVAFWGVYFLLIILLALFTIIKPLALNLNIILILIAVVFCYFVIGFKDDYLKIKLKKNEEGLSPKEKFIAQFLLSLLIVVILIKIGLSTNINFYIGNLNIDLGWLYYFLVPFIVVGGSNATNLSDGIDGFLTTNILITLISLSIIANIEGATEILISNIILMGTLTAFLLYNRNPAKIFMGDVGSLALGAYIAIVAILLKIEILLIFFGIIYIIETLSVIIQVTYFKWTKKKYGKGRRIFKMAPYHHHLEAKGYSEVKIVVVLGIVNICFNIFGLLIYLI